jgi:hypothetical protein
MQYRITHSFSSRIREKVIAIVGFSQTFNAGPSQIVGIEPDRHQKKDTQPSMGATSRARARRLPKAICSGTADATRPKPALAAGGD